jgi:RHS repeat-associated protein
VVLKNSGGTILKEERFTYDVFDRRIGVWVDADGAGSGVAVQTWTLYDGANPYADFNSAGSLTRRYLSSGAIDAIFARYDGTNADWYLPDRLGSVRQIARVNGTILNTLTYDSYGNILTESNPSNGDRFAFAGMERSSIGGPSYQWHRYYFSNSGVWASEDPLGFGGHDANLRRYSASHHVHGPNGIGLRTTNGTNGSDQAALG